jgi:Fe-S oxidoreductase
MTYPPGKIIATLRADRFEKVLDAEAVWMCVSCYACPERCSSQIPVTRARMTRTKEELVLAGNVPAELRNAVKASRRYGNPQGESPRKRADWPNGLAPAVPQLKRLLKKEVKARVTYHDPCYLGRVNKIYAAPRRLLEAIPGVELVEMPHNHGLSLCCGGGGGGMWLGGFQWDKAHARLSEWRVREAMATGATILAVACPYETPRFEDAVKTVKASAALQVKDIAELLVEAP